MNRPNIAVPGCTTKHGADGQGWQQLRSSDFNPSPQLCQSPQSRAFHLLTCSVPARHPKKAHWTRCTAHIYYSTLPASLVFFTQAWWNKFALGWENLCQVFHPKRVLIGSRLKLFKKQYLMKTNRCITAECHCKIVNMCHHPVLIAKLKKNNKNQELWQGNTVAIEVQLWQPQSSQQGGAPTHSASGRPCQALRARSPTQLPPVGWAHPPAHPAASSRPPPAQPHHDCWHSPGSWVNRKPLKIYRKNKKNRVSSHHLSEWTHPEGSPNPTHWGVELWVEASTQGRRRLPLAAVLQVHAVTSCINTPV